MMHTIKDRHSMDLTEDIRRGGKNTQKNYTQNILMTQITTMVWSFTYNQISYSVKSSGLYEALL